MKQLPLVIASGPSPSFDNFLPGRNAQAWAHLQTRPLPGTPVCLWGPAGSGKTHLLGALAASLRAQGRSCGVFSASSPLPWVYDEAWSAVLLDDCEALDEARQQAAFALFVHATASGIPVVAAAALPPVDLPLRDDLRSRLGWGLVFQLASLSEAEARVVLQQHAELRGVALPRETLDYLLTRFSRDLACLSTLIERLDDYAIAQHRRALTVPLIKQMLAED